MEDKFESWAIVELFGHTTIAGYLSEQEIGGDSFVRLDVPETKSQPAFTKFYGPKAIYGITPTTELMARNAANHLHSRPVDAWTLPNDRLLPEETTDDSSAA